jgi:hypothetical protein
MQQSLTRFVLAPTQLLPSLFHLQMLQLMLQHLWLEQDFPKSNASSSVSSATTDCPNLNFLYIWSLRFATLYHCSEFHSLQDMPTDLRLSLMKDSGNLVQDSCLSLVQEGGKRDAEMVSMLIRQDASLPGIEKISTRSLLHTLSPIQQGVLQMFQRIPRSCKGSTVSEYFFSP